MRKITQLSAVAVLAAALSALVSVGAFATANRTFVSGQGSDSNPCSLGAPCRSFAHAITQTAAGGEITVLDSAGYGTVTITQSVTITNPGGVEAGITALANEDAIDINTTSTATVTLRGLTLEGGGAGYIGIYLLPTAAGGTLNIIDCVVKDFSNNGILLTPDGAQQLNVVVANTFVLNNAESGILLNPISNQPVMNFSLYQVTASGNNNGVEIVAAGSPVKGLIVGSHMEQNTNDGLYNSANSIINENITSKNSTFNQNGAHDIDNASGALLLVNDNTITTLDAVAGEFLATDGTNNIVTLSGSLTKLAAQ